MKIKITRSRQLKIKVIKEIINLKRGYIALSGFTK